MAANPPPGPADVHEEEVHDPMMAIRRRWVDSDYPARYEVLDPYTAEVQAEDNRDLTGFSQDPRGSKMAFAFHPEEREDFDEMFSEMQHDHNMRCHQVGHRNYRGTPESCRPYCNFVDEPFFDDSFTADTRASRGRSARTFFQRESKNVVNLDRILRGVDCRSTVSCYIYIYNDLKTDCRLPDYASQHPEQSQCSKSSPFQHNDHRADFSSKC